MPDFPIIERIPADLAALLERFFDVARQDVQQMRAALDNRDFDELVRLGHTIRGTGSGYGFKAMGPMGHSIELAAQARDPEGVLRNVDILHRYLDTVQVEFED